MCKKLTCLAAVALVLGLIGSASADLVVHWALEEGSGTTATDSSGNGNDGTFNGAPEWVEGKLGGGLHVRGDTDQDYVVFTLPGGATVWETGTIAIWVKLDSLGQDQYSSPFTNHTPNSAGIQFDVDGGTPGNFRLNPGGQFFGPATTEWTHLALTFEGGNATFYYNGEEATTAAMSDSQRTFNEFAIGLNRNHTNWMAGTIDELRVYDHPLTAAEIQTIMFSSAGRLPHARRPSPADGAMLEQTWFSLAWGSGDGAVSHDLYFGTNSADVDDSAEGTFVGNLATTQQVVGFPSFPVPEGLQPGTTYYWRVDEVNDADPNSPWKGAVWSFTIPAREAYNPGPADGVGFALADTTLAWTPGFGAILHDVYFGDSFDDVSNATGAMPLADATFAPGALELDKTYYWRVDEFDGTATHKGDVWSFTTVPDLAVTDPDLQGWWTLDEGNGTTTVDWSGHGGHGSFVGDPQWVDGYQGTALEFDGGDFVDCGEEAGSGVTADFTFAAWVQMTPGNAGQYMGIGGKLSRLGGNADYMGFALVRHGATNLFRLWVGDGDAANILGIASSDVAYTDTEWHHVVGVREGQLNMLYVDGVRQAAGNTTGFVPSDLFLQIGRQYSNTNTQRQFKGKIDDVRLYNKALTDAQIADLMSGDPKLADNPVPGRDALLDTRDISSLSWSKGSTASSHDVYLGTDRDAVAGADNTSPEFQGNQAAASLSLAGLVEYGGGDYYWRVDEIEAGGAVNAGTIWKFTVPDYLIVDNFESYNNIDPPNEGSDRIFDNWADGYGTTTNGALVGNELPPYGEHGTVQSGNQSMLYAYDNTGKTSEVTLTVAKGDWTAEGVTKLVVQMRGASGNAADRVYVALNGTAVVYHDDASATQLTGWNEWVIDLAAFGVDLGNVTSISIGVGTKNAPAPAGGTGTLYFDEIVLTQ
jgi:hypothetical protein